eukprot:1478872-Rhodomonas_salina.1
MRSGARTGVGGGRVTRRVREAAPSPPPTLHSPRPRSDSPPQAALPASSRSASAYQLRLPASLTLGVTERVGAGGAVGASTSTSAPSPASA